ncbi:MAG: hypothetical protein ABW185_08085, partial [Sedimenticola sp.]
GPGLGQGQSGPGFGQGVPGINNFGEGPGLGQGLPGTSNIGWGPGSRQGLTTVSNTAPIESSIVEINVAQSTMSSVNAACSQSNAVNASTCNQSNSSVAINRCVDDVQGETGNPIPVRNVRTITSGRGVARRYVNDSPPNLELGAGGVNSTNMTLADSSRGQGHSINISDDEVDEEGDFTEYVRKRPKRYFVGGFNVSITEDKITKYIQKRGPKVIGVNIWRSKRDNNTAVIRLFVEDNSQRSKLEDNGFWPRGIECRPWMSPIAFRIQRYRSKGNNSYGNTYTYGRSDIDDYNPYLYSHEDYDISTGVYV